MPSTCMGFFDLSRAFVLTLPDACVQVVCEVEGAQLANALRAGGRRTASLVGSGVDPWSRRRRHRQMHLGALLRFHKEHLKKEW